MCEAVDWLGRRWVMTRGGGEGSGWARSRAREFAWATG